MSKEIDVCSIAREGLSVAPHWGLSFHCHAQALSFRDSLVILTFSWTARDSRAASDHLCGFNSLLLVLSRETYISFFVMVYDII